MRAPAIFGKRSPMPSADYVEEVPEYSIENGVVRCQTKGGDAYFMALPVFRRTVGKMARFLAKHDAAGQVVPFKGGKR